MPNGVEKLADDILAQAASMHDEGHAIINPHEQTIGGKPFPENLTEESWQEALCLLHLRKLVQRVVIHHVGKNVEVLFLTTEGLGYGTTLLGNQST